MSWFAFVMFGGLAVILVLYARPPSPDGRRARGTRLAQRYRMHIDSVDVPGFDEMLDRSRRRDGLTGALAAAVAGTVAIALELRPGNPPDFFPLVVVAIIMVAGAWIGALLGEIGQRLPDPHQPRAARSRSVAVGDFVHPFPRLCLGALSLAGLAIAIKALVGPSTFGIIGTPALALAAASVFVICELGAFALVRLPQPAPESTHLYVRDALRSELMTHVYGTGLLNATLCLGLAMSGSGLYNLALAVLLLISAAKTIVMIRPGLSHLRFRNRLWPDLSSDEIVTTTSAGTSA